MDAILERLGRTTPERYTASIFGNHTVSAEADRRPI